MSGKRKNEDLKSALETVKKDFDKGIYDTIMNGLQSLKDLADATERLKLSTEERSKKGGQTNT